MFFKGYNDYLKEFIEAEVGKKGVIVIQAYREFTLDSTQEPLKVAEWVREAVERICVGKTIHNFKDTSLIIDVNELDCSNVLDLMRELEVALMWEDHARDNNWNEPHFYNGNTFCNRGAVRAFGIDLEYK